MKGLLAFACCGERVCSWRGGGAAPVSRGVRSLGSTCRRGNVAEPSMDPTPRPRPQSKQVPPYRLRSSLAQSDPNRPLADVAQHDFGAYSSNFNAPMWPPTELL